MTIMNGQLMDMKIMAELMDDKKFWDVTATAVIGIRGDSSDEWHTEEVLARAVDDDADVAISTVMTALMRQVVDKDIRALLETRLETADA